MNEKILERIEECLQNAKRIYESESVEDYGQICNQSGEMEVLEIINEIEELQEFVKKQEDGKK